MNIPRKNRGFVLLATGACCIVLVGMLGLSVDLGRMYITKNEAQSFTDAAAVAAARELNGSQTGIVAARSAVSNSTNGWNMATTLFTASNRTVKFATSANGPWLEDPPNPPKNYGYVEVTASPSMSVLFLPMVGTASSQVVPARSVAGVVTKSFPKGGYMPFSPFAMDNTANFGFIPGQEYAILWPGNAKQNDACQGYNGLDWDKYNASDQVAGSTRGYFELNPASAIRDAILGARQMAPLNIGDTITLTNGQKQTQQDALLERANMDTDTTRYNPNNGGGTPNYSGNGMRMVIMPINNGLLAGGNAATPTVIGFGAFLLPMEYPNQGNKTWCAIYMGSYSAGSDGVTPYEGAGAYVTRLIQ